MTTLRTAAQQALETMEFADFDPHSSDAIYKAITALRAALAEPVVNQQLTTEPVQQGCDHCNHPLYAAIKCRVCGRVTEPVQEPVAWMMVNSKYPRLSKSLHWTPQTDWHITWESVPLYASPPRKPLTEEEIKRIDASTHFHESPDWSLRFARAIERAHGITS